MKKLIFTLLAGLWLGLPAFAATTSHISDDVTIFMHSGPSNQYRIKGRFTSGEPVTVLERNQATGYVHVRNAEGKDGWVEGSFVSPGVSVKERLPQLQTDYQSSQKQLSAQASELQELRASLDNENQARTESTARIAQLENRIVELQNQIDGMDETNLMRWFSYGGVVALAGLILGLIVPYLPKKRRRNDDWF